MHPKLNLSIFIKKVDDEFVSRTQTLAKAEAALTNALLATSTPLRREAFFARKGEYAFFVSVRGSVLDNNGLYPTTRVEAVLVGAAPEEFIGLGDGDFELPPGNSSNREHRPVISLTDAEAAQYPEGTVACVLSPELRKRSRLQVSWPSLPSTKIKLQRSRDGILFPMLAVLALRLTQLHGRKYTIVMAAAEIYDLEFTEQHEYMAGLVMPTELWTRTLPFEMECLKSKYGLPTVQIYAGTSGNRPMFWMVDADGNRVLPIAFYMSPLRAFPITFPVPQTKHLLLDNLDCIDRGIPVYLTEYPALCDEHHNAPFALLGFFGEKSIERIDFAPLAGKPVVYLEILADGETGHERAHRVALKAFARAYVQGNRNFKVLVWDTMTELPMEELRKEALERGYLELPETADRTMRLVDYLVKWPKPTDQGRPIVGRAICAGRVGMAHALPGVGKSLLAQGVMSVALSRKNLDDEFFQYTWQGGRQIRVLYVQNELGDDEIADRQKSIETFMGIQPQRIETHTPEGTLTDIDEQARLLKRLTEMDPAGEFQWMIWIDSIKTLMPDAVMGQGFSKKVAPMLKVLRDAGCCVMILHHDNKAGENYDGSNDLYAPINVGMHLEAIKQEAPSCSQVVRITIDKGRSLTGMNKADAEWRWTVDEHQVIHEFASRYEDVVAETSTSAGQATPPAPVASPANPLDSLPKTWDELKAVPEDRQRTSLIELWNLLGTIPKVASHLNISKESVEKLMKTQGVNEKTKAEYLASKNTR